MFKAKSTTYILIFTLLSIYLSACGSSTVGDAKSAESADQASADISETQEPARINGSITYQANTPDSTLYVVDVEDATKSYSLFVPGSMSEPNPMTPASFSIEVDPGSYYIFAYSANGAMASAYAGRADGNIYTLTLSPGEIAQEINLRLVYPQNPCQVTTLPASPDGLYPAIEGNPNCYEEMMAPDPNNGIINGQITFQAPPTAATYIYFLEITTGYWTSAISEASDGVGTFSTDVPPGEYKIWAFSLDGTQAAVYREPSSSEFSTLTIRKGETVEIALINSAPTYPCQIITIPAAPNGSYPAIEANPNCLDESSAEHEKDTTPATISGTISYQGYPTPTSILYLLNPDSGQWYWVEILSSPTSIQFAITVEPGTYLVFAHQSDGAGSQAAAFMETDGVIARVTLRPGQHLDGVSLTFAYPTSPCQRTYFPASPDGRFPEIEATC